jgi:cyclopropane-fatty-acyl-phospholipid synthase
MKSPGEKRLVQQLLDFAGVQIDGQAPCDIQVHNPDFYPRVIAGGSLALGESYMDGWWDCEALDQFFQRIMAARLDKKVRKSKALLRAAVKARLTRRHGRAKAFEVGRRHYDIGNDLFTVMLDKRMNYSCAGSFRARDNQLWQIVFSKIGGSNNTSQALNNISPTHRIR